MKKDKVLHFLSGSTLTIVMMATGFGPIVSFLCVYLMALTKEILDKVSGLGTMDPYDFIWTVGGWVVVMAVLFGVELWVVLKGLSLGISL